jgi:hypothetical protein
MLFHVEGKIVSSHILLRFQRCVTLCIDASISLDLQSRRVSRDSPIVHSLASRPGQFGPYLPISLLLVSQSRVLVAINLGKSNTRGFAVCTASCNATRVERIFFEKVATGRLNWPISG